MNSCFNPIWLPHFHASLVFTIKINQDLPSSAFHYQSLNVPENDVMLFTLWNEIQPLGLPYTVKVKVGS